MTLLHNIQPTTLTVLRQWAAYPSEEAEALVWTLPDWYLLLESTPPCPASPS